MEKDSILKVQFSKVKDKAKVTISIVMVINLKVNGKMIKSIQVSISTIEEVLLKENLQKDKCLMVF